MREMIVSTGHPPGNAAIVTLSADLAGNVPVTGAWTPPDLAVGGLQELAIGRFSDFACADYLSESYAELAKRLPGILRQRVHVGRCRGSVCHCANRRPGGG